MEGAVTIDGGFAEVGAGLWLMGRGQPAAFFGSVSRRRRRGWIVRDRSHLNLLETAAAAKCADSSRPFLTHIPCAAPVFAVSSKILVAPAAARKDARSVKLVPMSLRNAVCVTEFVSEWVVMATVGRTARMALADDETISVRPEAAVAWTGKMPTGFCPALSFSRKRLFMLPLPLFVPGHMIPRSRPPCKPERRPKKQGGKISSLFFALRLRLLDLEAP